MRFLVWLSQHREYASFCGAELEALSEFYGLKKSKFCEEIEASSDACKAEEELCENVFRVVDIKEESAARQLAARSVLTKAIVELWASGDSYEKLKCEVETGSEKLKSTIRQHVNDGKSFAFRVESFGKKLTPQECVERMTKCQFLFSGTENANLRNPDTTLFVGELWNEAARNANRPLKVYLGRVVALRAKPPYWSKYQLSDRPVLCPTSLDNELSFIMANQAQVREGLVVLDPFVGTGGLLIAATHFGGFAVGADIDFRVLKGLSVAYWNLPAAGAASYETPDCKDIFYNFDHYKMKRPEILRADNSASVWRGCGHTPWADVILTDPPYGIRAGARQSGKTSKVEDGECASNDSMAIEKTPDQRLKYVPPTVLYSSDAVLRDLMGLACQVLVDNGRIVFLLPIELESEKEALAAVRNFEDFDLLAWSIQKLSAGRGRALVTLKRRPRVTVKKEK